MKKLKRYFSSRVPARYRQKLRQQPTKPQTPGEPNSLEEIEPSPNSAASREPEPSLHGGCAAVSRFEEAPFDIRHQILLAQGSIENLLHLVHASPTYYRQYLPQQQFWLWRCLWVTLGPVCVDAYIINQCKLRKFRDTRTAGSTTRLMNEYKSLRSITIDGLFQLPNAEEVEAMTRFHMSVIRPLVSQYVAWTRSNLGVLSRPPCLSQTEERRIIRALYRFELFCSFFGRLPYPSEGRNVEGAPRIELYEMLKPWELEEVACINAFVDAKYELVFEQVVDELDPDHPRYDTLKMSRTPTPPGFYRLRGTIHWDYYKNGMVSRGLPHLLLTIETTNHNDLVELTRKNMTSGDDWMDDVFGTSAQDWRRQNKYSNCDRAQDSRDKMPFIGDKENEPPLAWVTIWRGTYSNLYGAHTPKALHTWGYVMWDADRLTQNECIALIQEQWNWEYLMPDGTEHDPRDEM